MRGRFWKLTLCALMLVVYAIIGLSSHRFEPDPPWVKNGAVAMGDEGVLFLTPGSARAAHPPEWLGDVVRNSSIEFELVVRSFLEQQSGPARVFTVSRDPQRRNLTIGQHGDSVVVRLRTVATDENGLPAYEIPGVFGDGELHTIIVTIDGNQLRLTVDGVTAQQDALPDEPLRNWDPGYSLLLGNEEGGQRPWLGEVRRATVRVRGRVFDYARAGSLIVPAYYHLRGRPPISDQFALRGDGSPLSDNARVAIRDATKNLCGFIPLGFILVVLWRRQTITSVMITCAALSLLIETTQLVVPGRYPHLTDFFLNVLGGALGALLGRALLVGLHARRSNQS